MRKPALFNLLKRRMAGSARPPHSCLIDHGSLLCLFIQIEFFGCLMKI
ncbi:hypothetical protein SD77_1258 [Bacillus badius]|uniref:Ribose 5-phosphate isomerase B n=1 Tax=Bacillus badius TaxID=1455 RepID=A0ABR5AS63_BACBA|nr:hypothetical protein SD78_3229 [Bacillus badius]KIL77585.1 hypothetical protein SD77_1258 [Bacillus badius]